MCPAVIDIYVSCLYNDGKVEALVNVGTPLKNARREKFCLNLVSGMSQAEAARQAGYSQKLAASASFGSALLSFLNVKVRLRELRDVIASESIMSVAERKERLSEIGKAKLRDYRGDPFADSVPNPGALSEVSYDPEDPDAVTKVKLHSPLLAIAELNKMERIYEIGTTVNLNQSIVNVQVVSPRAKELTEKILEGDRT